MKRLTFVISALFLAGSLAAGCSRTVGDDNDDPTYDVQDDEDIAGTNDTGNTTDDTGNTPDPDMVDPKDTGEPPTGTTVASLQQLPEGLECGDGSEDFINLKTGIDLANVVVTGPVHDAAETLEGFYVADKKGGPYSGIKVVAAKGEVPPLTAGDVVDLFGDVKEFYCLTEFDALTVTPTGETAPVPVEPVEPAAVAAGESGSEKYEGMLVELSNVKVSAEANQYGEFELEGGVLVAPTLYKGMEALDAGCTYDKVLGIVEFAYGKYRVLPRGADDLVPDPDGECGEIPTAGKTIPEIQSSDGSYECEEVQFGYSENVSVSGVVVVSPRYVAAADKLHGFWVMDPDGGEHSGLLLTTPMADDADYVMGDILDVEGKWQEFWCLTEINSTVHSKTGHTDSPPEPMVFTEPAGVVADGEKFEGVLLTVDGVKVSSIEDFEKYGEFTLEGDLLVDDAFEYDYVPTVGDELTSITGVLSFGFGKYRLLPRFNEDVVE